MISPDRSRKHDNIRAFLIFCVLLGHFLEGIAGWDALYKVIYTFHMPAFVFLSGYFARFKSEKLLRRTLLPYVLFQTLYIAFDRRILGGSAAFQYTLPYWLMWYLPALFLWNLLLPVIDTDRPGRMAATLLGCVALGLAAGFDRSINRNLTISRLLVFLPFFIAGVYWRKLNVAIPFRGRRQAMTFAAAGAAAGLTCLALAARLSNELYYGASGYEGSGGTPALRLLLYAAGAAWIAVIFLLAPDRPIPGFTVWGRHTMPIYLFHGFVVRLSQRWGIFHYTKNRNLCLAVLLSLTVMAIFGWFSPGTLTGAVRHKVKQGADSTL